MTLYDQAKSFFILAIFIIPLVFYAQESNQILELKSKLAEQDNSALDSAFTCINLANAYIYHDLDSATLYVDGVIQGIKEREFILPDTFHRHLLIKAWTHQGKGELTEAKGYMNMAINKAKNAKKRDTHLELVMNYGSLLVQTRDTSILQFVAREMPKVDTTMGKSDYILYTLLHQYESIAYAQEEEYEKAIRTLLRVSSSKFLKKIPNYKYGIRSALSKYMSFMGDHKTAAKQLELAMLDSLHIHQRKEVYYQLADLKLKVDSLGKAEQYMKSYQKLAPHTKANKRDLFYLTSKLHFLRNEFDVADLHIDSSLYYQGFIEDEQKLLEALLVRSTICEKKGNTTHLGMCIAKIDSLLSANKYLNTTTNLAEVSRVRLLQKLLQPEESAIDVFKTYEEINSKLVDKKINPQLVAAVLAFDNQEKQYVIDQLLQTKQTQSLNIRSQSNKLNMSIIGVLFFMGLSGLYWWLSVVMKRKTQELKQEKRLTEQKAAQERAMLQEKTDYEKMRLAQIAEKERKQLIAQQKRLENRVNTIESKKQELENRLKESKRFLNDSSIVFATKTKTYKIKSTQFMYAVAEKDGTRIYLKDKNFWIVIPLKEVLNHLPKEQFVRVFRSTVVNVDYINAVNSKYVLLENGEELALSRTYRDEVKKRVG